MKNKQIFFKNIFTFKILFSSMIIIQSIVKELIEWLGTLKII